MIDILFNAGLLLIFIGVMRLCYIAYEPKPYPKYHMFDQSKRWRK